MGGREEKRERQENWTEQEAGARVLIKPVRIAFTCLCLTAAGLIRQ